LLRAFQAFVEQRLDPLRTTLQMLSKSLQDSEKGYFAASDVNLANQPTASLRQTAPLLYYAYPTMAGF
jgi:hypothetical protein